MKKIDILHGMSRAILGLAAVWRTLVPPFAFSFAIPKWGAPPEVNIGMVAVFSAATELAQNEPGDLESRLSIAELHAALGLVHARARQYPEARQEFDTALNHFGELLQLRPQDAEALCYSGTVRRYLTALTSCLNGHVCKVSEMHLPVVDN